MCRIYAYIRTGALLHHIACSSAVFASNLHLLQDGQATSKFTPFAPDSPRSSMRANANGVSSAVSPRANAQRKFFSESQIGKSNFQKLLEPSSSQSPGIAPYRIVLGDVKDKVVPAPFSFENIKVESCLWCQILKNRNNSNSN